MSFSIPDGPAGARATEYRARAQQISAYASTLSEPTIRQGFLNIAASYQSMAQHLEAKFGKAPVTPTQPQTAPDTATAPAGPAKPRHTID